MSIECTTTCDRCQKDISDTMYISLACYQDNNNDVPELKRGKHFCGMDCLENWLNCSPGTIKGQA